PITFKSHSIGKKSRKEQLNSSMHWFSETSVVASSAPSSPHIARCTRDQNGVFHVFFSDNFMFYIIPEHSICWNKNLEDWVTKETLLVHSGIKARLQFFSQIFFNFGMAPSKSAVVAFIRGIWSLLSGVSFWSVLFGHLSSNPKSQCAWILGIKWHH
ncbi:hypothetical protein DI09_369p10, partial [Mitosporidium daphniae]